MSGASVYDRLRTVYCPLLRLLIEPQSHDRHHPSRCLGAIKKTRAAFQESSEPSFLDNEPR
jgi:hypothetical protein